MKILFIFTFLLFFEAHANMCEVATGEQSDEFLTVLVKEIASPGDALFFVKVHPDKDIIYFSGDGANIYDYSDPAHPVHTKVRGPYDPVPTPDGKFITTPDNREGLNFYSIDDQGVSTLIGSDKSMEDNYQSTGQLGPNHYKVMNRGSRTLFTREYSLDENKKMVPVSEVNRICENLLQGSSKGFDIPMMSKSGKLVGVQYNNSMKIVKIKSDNSCEVLHDLGIKTGKLEFDFNDSFAVFHSTELSPEGVFSQNIYKYDMETKQIIPLTDFIGKNDSNLQSFPAVKRNGNVVFRNNSSKFFEIESKKREGVLLKGEFHCKDGSKTVFNEATLDYWKRICEKVTGINSENMNALTISINEDSCKELKNKFAQITLESKVNYRDIDPRYLCPDVKVKKVTPENDLEKNIKSFKAPHPKFFKLDTGIVAKTTNPNVPSSCRNCHTVVNWDDPVKLAQQEVRAQLPETVLRSNRSKPCFPEQALARIKAQDQIKGDHLIRMLAGEQTSLQQHNPEDFAKLVSYLKESIKHCAN